MVKELKNVPSDTRFYIIMTITALKLIQKELISSRPSITDLRKSTKSERVQHVKEFFTHFSKRI
jgi:hypothetical protein